MKKECIEEYIKKLEKGIEEYMKMPLSQRSAEAVEAMVECWEHVSSMRNCNEEVAFDRMAAEEWMESLENEDGTQGAHWTVEETNSVGRPDTVSDYCWNAVMNMMYSDYYDVAVRHGVNTAKFYEDMARAFIFDRDARQDKVMEYYNHIVR